MFKAEVIRHLGPWGSVDDVSDDTMKSVRPAGSDDPLTTFSTVVAQVSMAPRTLEPSVLRMTVGLAGVLTLSVLPRTDANAQTWIGTTGFMTYDIVLSGSVIGKMVAVDCNADSVAGFAAGREHWSWVEGQEWRSGFKLIPVGGLPSHAGHTWQTFPHDHFDLSEKVPMPTVELGAEDAFYRVTVRVNGDWKPRGYMWLAGPAKGEQIWFGVDLGSDLVGEGETIRFETAAPPLPGSEYVYLLQ